MIFKKKKKFVLIILFLAFSSFFVFSVEAVEGGIIINEIMYDWPGADDNHEWVEIYNNSIQAIDITGWKFNDGSNHLLNVPPKNGSQGSMVILPGSFAILADDAITFLADHPEFSGTVIDTVMSLGQQEDRIYTLKILNKENEIIDEVSYTKNLGANGNGKTLERKDNNDWVESLDVGGTPGWQNSWTDSIQPSLTPIPILTSTPVFTLAPTPLSTFTSSSTLTPMPSLIPFSTPKLVYSRSVIINEFIPNPIGDDTEKEWIELFNEGDEPVDLSNWELADQKSKYTIPKNTIIGAKSYLVFNHSVSKISINNNGEALSLFDPNGDLAFKISYEGEAPENQSLARQIDGQWFWTTFLTPGGQNIIKISETAKIVNTPTPLFSNPLKTISPKPTVVNSPSFIPLSSSREEIANVPVKPSQVFSKSSSKKEDLNKFQNETKEDYFLNKNQTMAMGFRFNYKITGLAILIGFFSVVSILMLKKFLF